MRPLSCTCTDCTVYLLTTGENRHHPSPEEEQYSQIAEREYGPVPRRVDLRGNFWMAGAVDDVMVDLDGNVVAC